MRDIGQDINFLLECASTLASVEQQRSGSVPSAAERKKIDDSVSLLSSALPDIDAEIRRLHALRQRVCTQLDISHSVIAPVRRLPVEIISLIFLHICGTTSEAFDQANMIATTVAPVCLSWRTIAWSTPQLWNYISTESGTRRTRTYAVPSLAEQAALSGTLPLHIKHQHCFDDVLPVRFLEKLRPYASRWQTMEIGAPCTVFDYIPIIDMPNLADARIELSGPPTSEPLGFFTGASDLRQLTLVIHPAGKNDLEWTILQIPPFRTLTSLSLLTDDRMVIPLSMILPVLSPCSSTLTYLRVAAGKILNADDGTTPSVPTIMTGLVVVVLEEGAQVLLRHIAAPRLEELILREQSIHNTFSLLLAFLSHPEHAGDHRLQRLTLDKTLYAEERLFMRCLERLEALRELCIEGGSEYSLGPITEDMLDRLTCAEDHLPLLPNLSKLTLWFARRQLGKKIMVQLRAILRSRERPRVCASCDVAVLEGIQVILSTPGQASRLFRVRPVPT